jgi:hypothetical protein
VAKIVGEYIDRICTVEMRPGGGNLPRGVIHRLYDAARQRFGEPLVYRMASRLQDTVAAGDNVLILTGAGGPPVLPNAEVDGILGAVAIAKVLHYGLGANVVLMTEQRAELPVRAAIQGAGMNVRRLDESDPGNAVVFIATPIDRDEGVAHATEVFEKLTPTAVIGIEKLAPNHVGVIHGATGLNYDDVHTKSDVYFGAARDRGVLTCGIGDGGNEVGFGVIREAVAEIMPAGRVCLCPCQGGSAAAVATDEFVVAAISDWGGYALNAMLAYLTRSTAAMIGPDELERMLRATVNAGAFDGATGRPSLSDDGVPIESQRAYVTILRQLVEIALSDLASPGH